MTNFTLIGVITDVTDVKLDDDDYAVMLDITSKDAIYHVYANKKERCKSPWHAMYGYYLSLRSVKVLITGQIEVGSNGNLQLWATHIAPMDQD